MTTRFLAMAAIMVLAALACVLVPLLRSARREGRPRAPFVLALLLALATPPLVLGLYLTIGTPQALQPAPADNRATLKALAVAEVLQGRSERPEAPVHKPATRRLPEVVAVT